MSRRSATVAVATYGISCASAISGALLPCPLGWGSAPADTVKVARLATESGLFPVFEAERGEVTDVLKIRRRAPVEEYLKLQRRYAHLFRPERRQDIIDRLQERADRNIRRFGLVD